MKKPLTEEQRLARAIARMTELIEWYGWTEYKEHWRLILDKLEQTKGEAHGNH